MRQSIRVLAILIVALAVAAGCSRAGRSTRVSSAPPDSGPAVASQPGAAAVAPIPGHPPVTTTGVIAKFDPASGVVIFQDGRAVQLTPQSQILQPKAMQPVDPAAIRPGARVVVQNALPIGVRTASTTGKRQRMATVASVDQQKQTVRMTDGSTVRVTPSTNMHKGTAGAAMVMADLRPGDEVVIVVREVVATAPPAPAPPAGSAGSPTGGSPGGTQPSALPSQTVVTGAPSDPSDASELMVFRETEAP